MVIKIEKATVQFPCKPSKQQWVSSCAQLSEWRPLMNMSPKPGRPPTASTLSSPDPPLPRPAYFLSGSQGPVPLLPPVQQPLPVGTTDSASESTLPVPVLSCTKVRVISQARIQSLTISFTDRHTHTTRHDECPPAVSALQLKALVEEAHVRPLALPRPWPSWGLSMVLPHPQGRCVPTQPHPQALLVSAG